MADILNKAVRIFKEKFPEVHGHFTAQVAPTGYVVYIMNGSGIYAIVNTRTNTVKI